MNKKHYKILFIFFSILFFVAAPSAIFYAQGYRLDLEERKIVKTGGLFIKAFPKQCMIYIDDKFAKNTDFIFGEAFIKNLNPKEYKIRVEKSGYFPWKKILKVEEELVAKSENIILFPNPVNFSPVSNKVENYFFSPDKEKIILEKQGEENNYLELINSEEEKRIIINEEELNGKEIKEVIWNYSSEELLIKTEDEDNIVYSIIENINNNPSKINIEFPTSTTELEFNPYNSEELFFIASNSLFKLNFNQEKEPEKIIENLEDYAIKEREIFWINKEGLIFKSNISSGEKIGIVNNNPLSFEGKKEIEVLNKEIFIKNNNDLYYFDEDKKEFNQIEDHVNKISLSPDESRILITNKHEIYLFFPSEIIEQPRRKENSKVFLTRLSEEIKETSWLNNHYLIFSSGNKIKITEADNRDGLNIITIKECENPEIFWDNSKKRVYLLSNGNLYRSEELF
jgi:uncharacterized protein YneR